MTVLNRMPGLARRLLAAVLAAALPAAAMAQGTGTVTGKVSTKGGEALAGVTVSLTGTPAGAITRADGSYRLVVKPGRYQIVARQLGYGVSRDSVTIAAGGTATKDFTLEKSAANLQAVAVVGSRSEARTVVDAPAPIDVLSAADLRATGRTETAQMIQAQAPSFNFPRMSVGDGTDHVRPATLRGMGADQVLVLVNGKRRYASALVNVNGSIGRGQAAVDLNAIPASMIERIEVLRDGAAAQYGSDAIAGVINVVLKQSSSGEATTTLGSNFTRFGLLRQTPLTDGKVVNVTGTKGWAVGDGYFTIGGEFRERGWTNRSLPDGRAGYFAGDPRNTDPTKVGIINHRQGDAYTRDWMAFYNYSNPIGGGKHEVYAFGGMGYRNGEAAGFARLANDNRTVRAIWPDGFLPLIRSDIGDLSSAVGLKGTLGGWKYDASTNYGGNFFDFTIKNSVNASLGLASPRQFDAGGLYDRQWTNNLDLNRAFGAKDQVRLGVGAEYRVDVYGIRAGEPNSYVDGGWKVIDGPNAGAQPAAGAQVFPGFRPANAGRWNRNNTGVYLDLEADVTDKWLLSGATRYEDYSDFGSTTTGKVATRYKWTDGFNLRGAVSTGFRAPSLQQTYFNATSTNFVNGVPFEIRTFQVTENVAKLLGARPLTPEKSTNVSAGFAAEVTKDLSLTVDYYDIIIQDRIVFSENFIGTQVTSLLAANGFTGVQGGRYFTNAINTRTRGVDVVANYALNTESNGLFRLTAAFNAGKTLVTKVKQTPPELSSQQEALFGRVERGRIELGQPRNNFIFSTAWSGKTRNALVRAQRFGKVIGRGTPADGSLDNAYQGKWIIDVSGDFPTMVKGIRMSIGADNLFDTYPTANRPGTNNNGIFPYSGISPFGFNGRHVYTRLVYAF